MVERFRFGTKEQEPIITTQEFSFNEAVQRIADDLFLPPFNPDGQGKVWGLLHGLQNVGKSTFARALAEELRARFPDFNTSLGGEVHSFDPLDIKYLDRYKFAFFQVASMQPHLVNSRPLPYEQRILESAGFTSPGFSCILLNEKLYPQYTADLYKGKVNYIIHNPASRKK